MLINSNHPANILVEGREFINAVLVSPEFVKRWGEITIL